MSGKNLINSKLNLKYYNLYQNNSGGYYIKCEDSNNEVDTFISIQAPDVKVAKMIAEKYNNKAEDTQEALEVLNKIIEIL